MARSCAARSRRLACLLLLAAEGVASSALADAPAAGTRDKAQKNPLPRMLGGLGLVGAIVGAVPPCRRAVRGFLGADDGLEGVVPPRSPPVSSRQGSEAPATPDSSVEDTGVKSSPVEREKFSLTPDKLGTISDLNPQLEKMGAELASVPVFTAAVGNGTSPLTVPTEDRKLAYFFTERADAEAFLDAVRANTGADIKAQVIGVSLADIIRAYSSPAAKEAKEVSALPTPDLREIHPSARMHEDAWPRLRIRTPQTIRCSHLITARRLPRCAQSFVLIPTMPEVAAARELMRRAGKPADPAELSAATGLVPLFWAEELAVQSAAGKQRKVLFFRLADLQTMWQSLVDARREQGELEELPDGPKVRVSDLQTMSELLVAANKTDEIMFMPSSEALKYAQGGRQAAGAKPAGSRGGGLPRSAAAAGDGEGADDDTEDVMGDLDDVLEDEEDEEDESGGVL